MVQDKAVTTIANGARHFFQLLSSSRFLTEESRKSVDKVLQRNAFFALPENLLLAMVTNEDPQIRELGWRRIKKARKTAKKKKDGKIRPFVVPALKLEAESYSDMIDGGKCTVTEPPLLKGLSDEEISDNIKSAATLTQNLDFPCHTQGVERLVKLVTEASEKVFGEESRNSYIRAKLKPRAEMPRFETKRRYVPKK